MPLFTLKYLVAPPWVFGLPDGKKVVVPAGSQNLVSPSIDMRTRQIASHGALPVYRLPDTALNVALLGSGVELRFHDNYLSLCVEADGVEAAHKRGADVVDLCCQALSVQYGGVRFSASFQHIEDAAGTPHRLDPLIAVELLNVATYNLGELKERITEAFQWARSADGRARKALMYFEHACLLREFSQSLEMWSPHGALSRALSFLQLFKALSVILGEPGTDRDYQRRFRTLGLPTDFWTTDVGPLYTVRNEEDVAHYRLDPPDPTKFADFFGRAAKVFKETLSAHMKRLAGDVRDP